MAEFTISVLALLQAEGGYSNDENDPGGETNYGISKREFPNLDIKNLTREEAVEIYKEKYWQKGFEKIESQAIVNKCFGVGVNEGMQHAIRSLQFAVRAASGYILIPDGILGPESITAINACDSNVLLASLKSEVAGYYRLINNPAEIKGWLNRAYS